jgi:hypothetical protein
MNPNRVLVEKLNHLLAPKGLKFIVNEENKIHPYQLIDENGILQGWDIGEDGLLMFARSHGVDA